MTDLELKFTFLKEKGQKALIPFFTCGYPDELTFIDLLKIASDSGADVIELGIPFSDPLADGPSIQHSSQAALDGGITVNRSLKMMSWLSGITNLPLVIFTYANLVYQYGLKRFVLNARGSGISGIIVADLVVEESGLLQRQCSSAGVNLIHLVAPTSNGSRLERIVAASNGFIYLVSVTGVTGARKTTPVQISSKLKQIRRFTEKPVCVGFGISNPKQAKQIARFSDGIIVGSSIADIIRTGKNKKQVLKRVSSFLTSLKKGISD